MGLRVECETACCAVASMELVKDYDEKKRGKRAPLFDGLADGDRGGDSVWAVGAHAECGAGQGIADEVNELRGEAKAA